MPWYGMVWYCMPWYGMVWYGMPWWHKCLFLTISWLGLGHLTHPLPSFGEEYRHHIHIWWSFAIGEAPGQWEFHQFFRLLFLNKTVIINNNFVSLSNFICHGLIVPRSRTIQTSVQLNKYFTNQTCSIFYAAYTGPWCSQWPIWRKIHLRLGKFGQWEDNSIAILPQTWFTKPKE